MKKNTIFSMSGLCLLLTAVFAATAYGVGPYSSNGTTVLDNGTGLEWQQSDGDGGTPRTWQEALAYCEGLTLGGHLDWRLPNIRELISVVDDSRYSPAIDPVFQCRSSCYWSATTIAYGTAHAWPVCFDSGSNSWNNKTSTEYVRCVRAGLSTGPIQTVDLSAGSTAVLQPSSATELQSFGILEPLVIGTPFNADYDTFIIVHGWNPDDNLTSIPADSWERDMGSDLMDKTGVGGGNVLLWDWMDKARNDHYGTNIVQKIRGVPYSWVPASGENLAITLNNYLPPDYKGNIHMIGHSLGSGVIIYAAKWFKEKNHSANIKQLTLLDSPWIRHYPAGKFLKDNKDTLFVDNYNTMFGRPQGYRYADVNVFIRMNPINDENELLHVSFAHQFAHEWYRSSITNFQDKTILGDSTVPHEQMPYGFYWHSHQNGIAHRWLGDSPNPSWKVEVIPAEKIYGRVVSAGHNLQEFAGQTRNNLMQFAHETGTNVKILKANAMNRLSDLASYVTDQVGHAQWIEETSGNGQLMLILNSEAVVTRQMKIPAESNSFQFNYEFPSGTDPQTRLEVFFGDNMVFSVKATDVSIGVTQQSRWIDISALAGQQTDLSFRLSNPVDGPLGKVKLDDLIFAKLTVASAKFPWPMFLPAVTGSR